jgi:hypothetical protein
MLAWPPVAVPELWSVDQSAVMKVEAQNMIIRILVCLVLPMAASILVAAVLCRRRLRRGRRVSYGTTIVGACIVTLAWLICVSMGACFTPHFWSPSYQHDAEHKWDPEWPLSMLKAVGFIAAVCALAALGVVLYYKRRRKRDEIPVV